MTFSEVRALHSSITNPKFTMCTLWFTWFKSTQLKSLSHRTQRLEVNREIIYHDTFISWKFLLNHGLWFRDPDADVSPANTLSTLTCKLDSVYAVIHRAGLCTGKIGKHLPQSQRGLKLLRVSSCIPLLGKTKSLGWNGKIKFMVTWELHSFCEKVRLELHWKLHKYCPNWLPCTNQSFTC